MDRKLDFLTKELIDKAAVEIDENGVPTHRKGTGYAVSIEDKEYPYKLLVTEAAKFANVNLTSNDFNSNANNRLGFEKLTGYSITDFKEKMEYFNLNDIVSYKNDIGKKYDSNNKGAKTYFDTRSKLKYLGEQLGDSLGLTLVNNYNEKPNKMAGKGKGFVLKEYILTGFLPKKYKNLGNSIFLKLSFHNLHSTPTFSLDIDVNFSDENNKFNKHRDKLQKQASWGITVNNTFPTDWDSLLEIITPVFAKQLNYIETFLSNYKKMIEINKYIDILNYKKQIILQGPPGTGKTYTAQDIAEQMIAGEVSVNKKDQAIVLDKSSQFELIQFHPSYTYEDFVRGIVVESKDGNVAYKTVNKSLGEFAEKALENYNLSRKDNTEANIKKWIDEKFEEFKNEIEVQIEEDDVKLSGNVTIFEVSANSFKYGKNWKISSHLNFQEIKKLIKEVLENRLTISNQQIPKDISVHAHYRYTYYNALLSIFFDKFEYKSEATQTDEKKYILIIDEINRANLPSVLGELIYALEYRGEPVSSMYALDNGDNKITIPENLYIIGTMNTADRSVGHIDYAIRRRFAFKEILPKELTNLGDRFKKKQFEEVSKLFVKEIKSKSIELEASEHLSPEFADRPQDVWLGHSYFIEQEDEAGNPIDFNLRIQYEIIPILEEYIKDGILSNTEEVKKIIKDLSN